jgi:hypothetical protein
VITEAELAHWRTMVPWVPDVQVEQDLVLSRLIIEFARHPLLGDELVFRGGTCFHKLWLDRPWRYSEDLDYVRRTDGGVGDIFDASRAVATDVGFYKITTQVGQHPKVKLRSTSVGGGTLQVKVEMNTFERSPARPPSLDPSLSRAHGSPATSTSQPSRSKNSPPPRSGPCSNVARAAICSTCGSPSNTAARPSTTSSTASSHTDPLAGQSNEHSTTSTTNVPWTTSPATSTNSSAPGLTDTASTLPHKSHDE